MTDCPIGKVTVRRLIRLAALTLSVFAARKAEPGEDASVSVDRARRFAAFVQNDKEPVS